MTPSWMSAPSTSPGAAEKEAATSKIYGLIILSVQLIGPLSCWAERRQMPATVWDRLRRINHQRQALLLLPGECSNPTRAWHATNTRVNTHSATHSREPGVAFTAFGNSVNDWRHFNFAFTEPLSGVFHLYVVISQHAGVIPGSICKSGLLFFCHWRIYRLTLTSSNIPNALPQICLLISISIMSQSKDVKKPIKTSGGNRFFSLPPLNNSIILFCTLHDFVHC